MPHSSVKLIPGVDNIKTPTLNEAAISSANLVRFIPDRQGMAYVQKLGGWAQWYGSATTTYGRAMHAWEDLALNKWLGIGTVGGTGTGSLYVINQNGEIVPTFTGSISTQTASFTASISGVTLTVSAVSSGTVTVGMTITGSGISAGTTIYAYVSPGVYALSSPQGTIGSESMSGSIGLLTATMPTGYIQPLVIGMTVSGTGVTSGTTITQYVSGTGGSGTYYVSIPQVTSSTTMSAVLNAAQSNITPQETTDNCAVNVSVDGGILLTETGDLLTQNPAAPVVYFKVAAGGNNFTIVDSVATTRSVNDYVNIQVPIAVGGIVLQGVYDITSIPNPVDPTTYVIYSPVPATDNAVNTGTVPSFAYSVGSPRITVTLANHGYSEGSNVAFLVPTYIGNTVTIYGNYTALSVTTNTFDIIVSQTPLSSGAVSMNSGNARYLYYLYVPPGSFVSGYGYGGYGLGGYGVGQAQFVSGTVGTPIKASDWSLDNFGQILVASSRGGPIFYYDPSGAASTATIWNNAPIANNGCFVTMPQRQIVAYGSTFNGVIDPLLIRWSDVGDPTTWIGTAINQAGSYRLPEGSGIVAGLQTIQQALFWTDESLWSMQYIGPPLIYSFNKIASGVGAIGPKSAGSLGNAIYWMSPSQFNVLTSNGIQPLACPVWDVIFQNIKLGIDTNTGLPYAYNIRCATNSEFSEVTWHYPSSASVTGENDSYVKFNTITQTWDYGNDTGSASAARSAWTDQSVLGSPMGIGSDLKIYQHETYNGTKLLNAGASSMPSTFTTGYFSLSDGDQIPFVDQIWPDMKWNLYENPVSGTVQITFYGTNYPGDTPVMYGPYSVTQATEYISTRIRNRLLAIQVSSSDSNSFWRLGNMRYRSQQDGKY